MRRSGRVLASAVVGLLVGLLTTMLLVVPAGAAFASDAKAPSDRPTYAYDTQSASTTPVTSTRTAAPIGRSSARRAPGVVRLASGLFRAAKAGEDALRTVTALTREQDTALSAVMRDPNRLEHIFGQGGKHNIGQLTNELGGQEAVVREAILRIPRSQPEGVFKIATDIGPHSVTVTGRMMNGVPRVSNVWVP